MKKILLNVVQKTSKNYKKYSALIDDDDFDKINKYKWSIDSFGYAVCEINGKLIRMHAFITGYKLTDHKDRNKLNNQKANLREATVSQNLMNKPAIGGTSKFKGVCWDKKKKSWLVQVCGKFVCYKKDEIEASRAYDKRVFELFGEYAKLNQI